MDRKIPQDLFVGTIDGVTTCTPDDNIYEIWPKFIVMIVQQGSQHFTIDDVAFRIDAKSGESNEPVIFMLNVARFARLRFINDCSSMLRKVQISAPRPWVEKLRRAQDEAVPTLDGFFSRHLASFRCPPSRRIISLAEQLMAPPQTMKGEVLTLYRNSRALEIMCAACELLLTGDHAGHRPEMMSRRQSERVRDFILDNLDGELTMERIAREIGASVSSVQRHFKEHFGATVFEFIRSQRLAVARDALQRKGVTIAQAAYAAGYTEPAHFTTAFKRAYGVTPKYVRR